MLTKKLVKTSLIAAIVVASIAIISGFLQNISAVDEVKESKYIFAEGVHPQATFKFKDVTATYQFQVFTQNSGFGSTGRGNTPEFQLIRVPGNTPYLYEAVDEANHYATSGFDNSQYGKFDVTVSLIQNNTAIRAFDYKDCRVSGYKVITEYDKEEGYTTGGKTGFALQDQYTVTCAGFWPKNPLYDELIKAKSPY